MKFISFSLCLSLAAVLGASSSARVKIDLDGRNRNIEINVLETGGGLRNPPALWLGENLRKTYAILEGTEALTGEWQDFSFSFTPDKSGDVNFTIRGIYKGGKDHFIWTAYRNFQFDNAAFADYQPPETVYGSSRRLLILPLLVTAGEKVTVRFQAKAGDLLAANAPPPGKIHPFALRYTAQRRAADWMPQNYYSFFGDGVKLLPLADKGLAGATVGRQAGENSFGRPLPSPPFHTVPAVAKQGNLGYARVSVHVLNETSSPRQSPLRFGFPLPKGGVYSPEKLRLLDSAGNEIPAQYSISGYWPDQSLKWVLIQCGVELTAHENKEFFVEAGEKIVRRKYPASLRLTRRGTGIRIDTGRLQAEISGDAFNFLQQIVVDGREVGSFNAEGLVLADENGKRITGKSNPVSIEVEEAGTEMLTLLVKGRFETQASYICRLKFYRDSAIVRMEITCLNDSLEHEFNDFTSLAMGFKPSAGIEKMNYLTRHGEHAAEPPGKLFQSSELTLNDAPGVMTGSMLLTTAAGAVGAGIRDAAARYPKGVEVSENELRINLLPELPGADFGDDLPHYLRFPFVEGKYRLKWGMSFTEKLCFDFSPSATLPAVEAENNYPLIAVIDRDWYFSSRVISGSSAGADHSFDQWDRQVNAVLKEHLQTKAVQREYGFLNYGDWFGERVRNWGNNEYDLAYGMFVHFIRTGNREAARLASAAAQHQADVDIIKAYPDPYFVGGNAPHGVGHLGTNSQAVPYGSWTYRYDLNFSASNGHTWSQGMLMEWALNGNAGVMNSAMMLGEHIVWFAAPNFTRLGNHERSAGWNLKAVSALYDIVPDKLYLEAAGKIAGVALKAQNLEKGGAWPHELPGEHAGFQANSFGNCPYLIGILLEGLRHYHAITGSEEAGESIIAAAAWLKKSYLPQDMAWPYGASWDGKPYNPAAPSLNLLIAPAVIYAANLTDDVDLFNIASAVMDYAIFKGLNPMGKALSLDIGTAGGLLDGLSVWNHRHPGRQYIYSEGKVLSGISNRRNMSFRVRGPEIKNFIIRVNKDNPDITIIRTPRGLRPRSKPEGTLSFHDAGQKQLLTYDFSTKKAMNRKFRIAAAAGDWVSLKIDDDLTASWNIPASDDYDAFLRLENQSSFSLSNSVGLFYFTVPPGTTEFTVKAGGIHNGAFGVRVYTPEGESAGEARGIYYGATRMSWIDHRNDPDPGKVLLIKPVPSNEPQIWSVLTWASGDISLSFSGIPNAVSIKP